MAFKLSTIQPTKKKLSELGPEPSIVPKGPTVNTTPYDVEPIYGDSGQIINLPEINAGKKGYSFAPKLPPSLNPATLAKLSTSAGSQYTANYIGPKVKQDIAPNEPYDWQDLVKVEDEDVMYLDLKTEQNPKGTNRWVKVPGINVAGIAKGAAEVGGYLGMAKLGTPVSIPASIAGAVGAGMAGAGSEALRLGLGSHLGINTDLPEGSITRQAIEEGIKTGAFSIGGDLAMGHLGRNWGPRGDYFFNPGMSDNVFNPDGSVVGTEATKRVQGLHDMAVAEGRAGFTANEKYTPSIARQSGVQELLDLEATLAQKQQSARSAQVADKIRANETSSTRVLDQVLDFLLPSTGSKRTAGRSIQDAVADGVNSPQYQAGWDMMQTAEGEMVVVLNALGESRKLSADDVIAVIRGSAGDDIVRASGLEGRLQELGGIKDAAWKEVNDLIYNSTAGIGGKEIAVSNIRIPAEGLQQTLEKDLLTLRYQTQIMGSPMPDQLYNPILKYLYQRTPDSKGAIAGDFDLGQLLPAIKNLKNDYRSSVGNRDLTNLEERTLLDVQKKLEDHMLSYLSRGQHGDIYQAYMKAKSLTLDYENFAQRTIAKNILSRHGGIGSKGQYQDPGILNLRQAFANGNAENAKVLREALKNDPEALQVVKDYLYNDYLDTATKNGIVNPTAHARWMKNHGEQLRQFTSPEEYGQVDMLGRYGTMYKEGQKKHKELMQLWERGWGGKVGKLNSESVGKALLGERLSVDETRQMVRFLQKNSPEVLDKAEEIVGAELRTKLFNNTQKATVSDTFNKLLEPGSGSVEKLEAIYGADYVRDLRIVYGELQKWQLQKGKPFGLPANTAPLTFARVVFGPLSKAQRFLTAAKQFELQGYEKAFLELITDPAKLKYVLARRNMPYGHPSSGGIMAILGSEILFGNPELEVPK